MRFHFLFWCIRNRKVAVNSIRVRAQNHDISMPLPACCIASYLFIQRRRGERGREARQQFLSDEKWVSTLTAAFQIRVSRSLTRSECEATQSERYRTGAEAGNTGAACMYGVRVRRPLLARSISPSLSLSLHLPSFLSFPFELRLEREGRAASARAERG